MSQRIRDIIKKHSADMDNAHTASMEQFVENLLLDFILSEIEQARQLGYDQALLILRHEVAELKEERLKIMKTAAELKITSDALKAAVDGAIGLIGNPTASTPDSTVTAFQSDVQAQVDRLNAAEAPPPPPPPPTP